jgi:hypothetical protein
VDIAEFLGNPDRFLELVVMPGVLGEGVTEREKLCRLVRMIFLKIAVLPAPFRPTTRNRSCASAEAYASWS